MYSTGILDAAHISVLLSRFQLPCRWWEGSLCRCYFSPRLPLLYLLLLLLYLPRSTPDPTPPSPLPPPLHPLPPPPPRPLPLRRLPHRLRNPLPLLHPLPPKLPLELLNPTLLLLKPHFILSLPSLEELQPLPHRVPPTRLLPPRPHVLKQYDTGS